MHRESGRTSLETLRKTTPPGKTSSRIRLIACDMDGTLLNDEMEISDGNRRAIHRLADKGIYFVIATGRHDSMVRHYIAPLEIEHPVISCNGAMVREPFTNRLYDAVPMSIIQLQQIIKVCGDFGADYHLYARDLIYGENWTNRMAYYRNRNLHLSEEHQVPLFVSENRNTFLEDHAGEIFKVLIIPKYQDDHKPMSQEIDRINEVEITQSHASLFDVTLKGATKSRALRALCENLNIAPKNILAIGDHLNDIGMIEFAGIGIAMNNAVDEVKAAADFCTTRNNNDDGVAEVLENIMAGC